MEIEKNPNPNSHNTSKSWSDLPLDLLNSVFERLGFADFQRAKSVCPSWHSASKQSVPKSQIHWLILFPKHKKKRKKKKKDSRCTLFNPEEKGKLYKTKDLGSREFAKSECIATYGSWLLMENPLGNLYIVNLFNQNERMINLPPREKENQRLQLVFWIDEKTKDCVVIYGRLSRVDEKMDLVYCYKKGDDDKDLLWKQIPETLDCIHLVYKDHKLYFLSLLRIFKILDFQENVPKETFQCRVYVDRLQQFGITRPTQLVVSVTKGREVVFKVEEFFRSGTLSSFRVLKIYSSGFLKIPEVVDSLGDEAMLLDQGITVLAGEENEGFVRNSIYFSDCCDEKKTHNIFRYNLETKTIEPLHEFDSSSVQFSRARWFLPSFTQT